MEHRGGLLGSRPKVVGLLGNRPKSMRFKENANYDKVHPFSALQVQRNRFAVPKSPLLPQPVPKIRLPNRKQPLLHTPPISDSQRPLHRKPLLIKTPYPQDKALSSFRDQQPSSRKSAHKIQKDGMCGKHDDQQVHYKEIHHNVEDTARNTHHCHKDHDSKSEMDAYQLHLVKLQKSAIMPKYSPEPQNSIKYNSGSTESKDGRGDLSCLASYLLQIKSFSSNFEEEDRSNEEKDNHKKLVNTSHISNPSQKVDNGVCDSKSMELCIVDTNNKSNFDIAISETRVQDNSLTAVDKEALSSVAEEPSQSCNVLMPELTEVVSKPKKHKIQLSSYASGNDHSEGGGGDMVKRKKLDSSDGLLQLKVPKSKEKTSLCTSKYLIDEVVQPVSETDGNKTNLELRSGEKPSILLKDPLSESNSSVVKLEPVLPSSSPDILGRSTLETEKGEKITTASPRSLLPDHPTHDKVKEQSKGSAVEDLPYIIPVSGYFCDLCCDFFFDAESTFQHCRSHDHLEKANASSKTESSSDNSPASTVDLSANCDAENVVHRKKKEKPQSARKSPFLHPRIAPQKNARKSTRPIPRDSSVPKGKKSFDWNFVIPKRK